MLTNVPCSEAEHQRNRRVEFRVTDFTGTIQSKEPEFIRKKAGTSETSMIQPEAKPVIQSPTIITATTGTSFTVQVGAGTIPMSRFKDIPDVKRMKGKTALYGIPPEPLLPWRKLTGIRCVCKPWGLQMHGLLP